MSESPRQPNSKPAPSSTTLIRAVSSITFIAWAGTAAFCVNTAREILETTPRGSQSFGLIMIGVITGLIFATIGMLLSFLAFRNRRRYAFVGSAILCGYVGYNAGLPALLSLFGHAPVSMRRISAIECFAYGPQILLFLVFPLWVILCFRPLDKSAHQS